MSTEAAKGTSRRVRGGKASPMMSQYWRLKDRCGDAILMFRLGDFYEMFFEDAERAAGILDIALTSRNKNDANPVPLCGVPFHSAQPYIARLLDAGLKVAICEQVEDPKKAKGLVERQVVRVVTPGTVVDEGALEPQLASFLVAICLDRTQPGSRWGLAAVDFSTGEVKVTTVAENAEGERTGSLDALVQELGRLEARELLLPSDTEVLGARLKAAGVKACLSSAPAEWFVCERAGDWLAKNGSVGGELDQLQGAALAGILSYLQEALHGSVAHLGPPRVYSPSDAVVLDEITRGHLDLIPGPGTPRAHSLLGVLDRTVTPMGARSLRNWLLYPLIKAASVRRRLDAVEAFFCDYRLRRSLLEQLRGIGDLERLAGRLGAGTARPRDLLQLAEALERLGPIKDKLASPSLAGADWEEEGTREPSGLAEDSLISELEAELSLLPQVVAKVRAVVSESAGVSLSGGGIVKEGHHPEVDELRRLAHDSKQVIARLEAQERARTGIPTLKVRYNRVFGYYIEVTRANLHLVPDDYERKQTLVGAERFITAELKDYERRVLGAQERLSELESELFAELVGEVAGFQAAISGNARALGLVDGLLSLAQVAHERGYSRPLVDDGLQLFIREGRHPVVETTCRSEGFVPNDSVLDPVEQQIVLLTGPNMAGKSTYLRQVALITVMAQVGSFVPAAEARIGVVDRIFTRVGASDNLAAGESTFMMEMRETARILSGLTARSLLILDEIGRGTSTFDGIAIAWSVIEYLHDSCRLRPKTLFATHFYELTDLAQKLARLKNYSVAVREWKDDIIFLRQVVAGPASRSYGIQVARLAGLPEGVIARAKDVLLDLEGVGQEGSPRGSRGSQPGQPGANPQLELFARGQIRLRDLLAEIDVTALTPLDAMLKLAELVEEARGGEGEGGKRGREDPC